MKKKSLSETLIDASLELGFEKATVDKLESLNIPKVKKLSARQIRKIRERENVSQGVFAIFLNVSISTVQKWERGDVQPQNAALRLLNLVAVKGLETIAH